MQLIMEHRPRYHQPWWVKMPDHPGTHRRSWTRAQKVVNRVYLALDSFTMVRQHSGHNYWTHSLPSGISEHLCRVHKHVATDWSQEKHPDIDAWILDRIPEGCAYRELTVNCWMNATYLSHRWRLANRDDLVLFRLTWC
jgi:hypothetical protein